METTKENQEVYSQLGIDLKQLKLYYLNRATHLINLLEDYKDDYAMELKKALKSFVEKPIKDLKNVIDEVTEEVVFYNSFSINNALFDIRYVDSELIDTYLSLDE